MLMVRSPLSRYCLQVTVDRSSFCAAVGADTASDVATSDTAKRNALTIFTMVSSVITRADNALTPSGAAVKALCMITCACSGADRFHDTCIKWTARCPIPAGSGLTHLRTRLRPVHTPAGAPDRLGPAWS